jgi:hypothetical protein
VIAHIVLFRPRATLAPQERAAFFTALEHAFSNIAAIKRARVGQRRTLDRFYDQQNAIDFPYAAIVEFENESDLREYLDHPAHRSLGEQFYLTSEASLVFDFELVDGGQARDLLA